jgi:Planctomycete cytochrome C
MIVSGIAAEQGAQPDPVLPGGFCGRIRVERPGSTGQVSFGVGLRLARGRVSAPAVRCSDSKAEAPARAVVGRFVKRQCVECHDGETKPGGLALDLIRAAEVERHAVTWEKVVRKLRTRQMPPSDAPRPSEAGLLTHQRKTK